MKLQANSKEQTFIKIMSALNDKTRVQIVYLLSQSNFCGMHLEKILNVSQANISRHCDKLVNANIIVGTKQGRRTIYNLEPHFTFDFHELIKIICELYEDKFQQQLIEELSVECKKVTE